MLKKVISGGQTGVDMAGLDAALATNFYTGGTAAFDWTQSIGKGRNISNPKLASVYRLKMGEVTTRMGSNGYYEDVYHQRTMANVSDSSGTIWFGRTDSPGARLTLGTCDKQQKLCMINPVTEEEIRTFINRFGVEILNIAGNREWTNPGIYKKAYDLLLGAFVTL